MFYYFEVLKNVHSIRVLQYYLSLCYQNMYSVMLCMAFLAIPHCSMCLDTRTHDSVSHGQEKPVNLDNYVFFRNQEIMIFTSVITKLK